MTTMKLGDALSYFRGIRQDLIDQKKKMIGQRDSLQKKAGDSGEYADEIATLELSLEGLKKQEDENYKTLNELTERYAAIWNAEVAKQQGEACQDIAEDMAKIMEVARRISNGDKVPQSDEKKLMEYNPDLYQAAKSMATLNAMKKHKEYKSLWEDEEEKKTEYDPEGKAENATVTVNIPERTDAATAVEMENVDVSAEV